MRCEEALNQLNARADGELPSEAAAELDAHLAECSQCRSAAEGLQTINAELRRAFVPRREAAARLAERAVAMVQASAGASASVVPPAAPAPRLAWGQVLLAAAAGFLLAVVVFRPWQSRAIPTVVSAPIEPVARLTVASGPVEMRRASQLDFMRCPTSAPIGRDSIVRTGPTAQCELSLQDGNSLRLDCNTEVTLHESEVVEVSRGRLCSTTQSGGKGLEIQSGGGRIVANAAAEFAVDCQPQAVRLIVVNGTANVQTSQGSTEIGPGKHVRIVQGRLEKDSQWSDPMLETAWVNRLLALRDSEHPKLAERVNRLLANAGAAKLSFLYEDELRRLGDDGVPPLLAYLASTRDTPTIAQRATAARVVGDVAESRSIPDLIGLLTDANPDVRLHAARGLERLTGRDQGCKAPAWQSGPWNSCEGAYQNWLNWWTANRDRYPAARRDIPAAKLSPF